MDAAHPPVLSELSRDWSAPGARRVGSVGATGGRVLPVGELVFRGPEEVRDAQARGHEVRHQPLQGVLQVREPAALQGHGDEELEALLGAELVPR